MSNAGKRLSTQRHKYSVMRRQMTIAANAEGHTLKPWHKTLALWLVNQIEKPSQEAMIAQAQTITRQKVAKSLLVALLKNPAFQAYKLALEEEETTKARAVMESRIPKAVEQHFDALDKLIELGKYGDVYRFTNPILERVWPADQGQKPPAQIITINLGGAFQQQNAKLQNAVDITEIAEVSVEQA